MGLIKLDTNSIVHQSRSILFSRIDDDYLAVDGQEGYCYSLNESAARAWELIHSPTSVNTVCIQLSREFTVDLETCERDVLELFQKLHEAGLLTESDEK